ncbi:MAG TPA: acyltransferase family protein [Labilithrix sp.]|nr:acyltransferase family protein [Labilithrix sp.]
MTASAESRDSFRTDIEGLRAVAVLLVLFFHAGLPPKGGFVGVDIFFVISGFLTTGILLREFEAKGNVHLFEFYGRRARRLIPAASVVLLLVALLTFKLAPITQRSAFGLDVVAAGAFVVNWRFADRLVDYLAEDIGRSPILHFWSLSVEEQFYFVWPLMIMAAAAVAHRTKRSPRDAMVLFLAPVVVLSFVWSVEFTKASATEAFLVTTTRLWELGIGAFLALLRPHLATCPPRLALPMTCMGAVLIAVSAVAFRGNVHWPGARALCPTIGTGLLISGGEIYRHNAVSRLLSSRPLVWIGGLSYSLYLWHWPAVVIGQDWLALRGPAWGAGLVLASCVPAWLSHRFIERPIRFSRDLTAHPRFALSLGVNLSLACIAGGLLLHWPDGRTTAARSYQTEAMVVTVGDELAAQASSLGAAALGRRPRESSAGIPQKVYTTMTPSPSEAGADLSSGHRARCLADPPFVSPIWCEMGDPNGTYRVVVTGDSKIFQYFDALHEAGKALGWRILSATKAACPFADAKVLTLTDETPFETCREFDAALLEQLRSNPPDVMITSQYANRGLLPGQSTAPVTQVMIDGLVRRWSEVRSWGTKMIVILDNPTPNGVGHVYECLLQHPKNHEKCAFDRATGILNSGALTQRAAAERVPGTRIVDLTDYICPQDRCAPVIGNVLVYRQSSHLTNTYARSLAPVLTAKLAVALHE